LKTHAEYTDSLLAFPTTWNFKVYVEIFKGFRLGRNTGFLEMAFNSIWMAFGQQALEVIASAMVAYPLARYNFPGKEFFYGIIIFRMTIPIVGGGGAAYKLLRNLKMINNPPLYALTWFVGFDSAALIMYGYFKNISKEYSEAAFMDGATKLTTLIKIVMPQAWPCVLALYVSAVMGSWNNYTTSMLYLTKFPNLAYGIYALEKSAPFLSGGMPMYFGAIILSATVPLALFIGGQKTMLTNMSVGGLKG
jgi:ABC-type glycerol-3-phosphate transport system permease component